MLRNRLLHTLPILLMLIILLISACSKQPGEMPNVNMPPEVVTQPADNGEHADQIKEEKPIDEVVDSDDPNNNEDDPIDETIPITYYMNSNYIIKPIDPDDNAKVVLLTFDDGPKEEGMVTQMLDVLDKHDAKAIFFVNGQRIANNPDLLLLIHERGQVIGNHSWSHPVMSDLSEDEIDKEIDDVQHIVEELIGEKPLFFRPPHAATNRYIKEKVEKENMLYMHWSNGSRDWEKGFRTTEAILGSILDQLHPGSNILMHELEWTVEALDTILTTLADQGFSFVDPRTIHLEQGNPTESDLP